MGGVIKLGFVFFLAATSIAEECLFVRDVEVIVELPATFYGDYFFTHVVVQNFIKSLYKKEKERCFKLRTTVIDQEIIPVQEDGVWGRQLGKNSPEQNLNILLDDITRETEFSPDSPKKVVLIVIGETPGNPELIVDKAKALQEVNSVFIVVGVKLLDLEGKLKQHFKQIARKDSRIFNIEEFQDLAADFVYFDKLVSLFQDPDKKFTGGAAVFGGDDPEPLFVPDYSNYDNCTKHVDIGIVIDGSGSLEKEYVKEIQFVMGLVKTFNVSKHGSHAGVIQFSKTAKLSIKLNEYTDADTFNKALAKLKPQRLTTRIDIALKIARDDLFAEKNGGRPDKKKLLVIITDGNQTVADGYTKPEVIADEIRQKGIGVLVIGVGKKVDVGELSRIAGPSDNWRKAKDFDELRSKAFVDEITRKSCYIDEERECAAIVDICFIFDASGSIDENTDFPKMKEFAVRIANTFVISESGAHGGLVLFSDFIKKEKKKIYSKVAVYLSENKTPTQFRHAVERAEYLGWRTRIDLGFKLAEEEVFNVKNGGRPNVKRVIILLTDGTQNPDKPIYDPVKASQNLYDRGVNIYAIGVGRIINRDQLEAITRQKHRVFYADTFKALESMEFVKNVSTTACQAGTRPTPKPKCKTPVKPCSGGCSVFNNIFNLNLGPTYIVNGAQIGKNGESLSGTCAVDRCKTYPMNSMNIEQLMKIIRTAVEGMCKGDCKKTQAAKKNGGRGPPAVAKERKRRSISSPDEEDLNKLKVMTKLSKAAGCNMFIKALKKYGIFKNITDLMKQGKHVSIFCPVDVAYVKIYEKTELAENEKNILLNHVGLKHDKFGTMYHTLTGGKILFNAVGKEIGKTSWKANGADVVVSLADGINSEIIIMNDVILPVMKTGILDALKKNADVSVFYNMLMKSQMKNVFTTTDIKKICFTADTCVSLTSSMISHLKDAVNFNHFTIVAPTNEMFKKMPKSKLHNLLKKKKSLQEFLQQHVFLGSLGNPDSHKEIAYSLSSEHLVMTTTKRKGTTILTDSNGREFGVKSSTLVKEGMLHIVDTLV